MATSYRVQGQPTNKNVTSANAAMARDQESSSELAQSSGEISRLLLSKAKSGMEFGSFNRSNSGTSEYSSQSELNSSNSPTSQILASQAKK